MSAEDIIRRAAEVIHRSDHDWYDDHPASPLPAYCIRLAQALNDAGLLAEPDEGHDPQSMLEPGELVDVTEWANHETETWRLRGEFIDAQATGPHSKVAEAQKALVAHLDAEATP